MTEKKFLLMPAIFIRIFVPQYSLPQKLVVNFYSMNATNMFGTAERNDHFGVRRNAVVFVSIRLVVLLAIGCFSQLAVGFQDQQVKQPNVLFISIDDLNDWIGCLGGHPQALTPNIDRLAQSSVLFTNAHCPSPSCNPSRTAIMTGLPCYRSGLYDNRQRMRTLLPDAEIIPKYFSDHGYWSAGSGKLLHYFIDAQSWNEYYPPKETENPFPSTLYPESRPLSLPRAGDWHYIETDWGPLDVTDQEFGGDWLVADWISKQLAQSHDKPFFLACGIYRPHEPWFVPKKYFDLFLLDSIQLPPGYREDDLQDLPEAARQAIRQRYFDHIKEHDQWKKGVQGYLASIAFADAMVGRVLDALDQSSHRDNTIVVLWSDHGWHLGEKNHWQKYTAWRACSRVPLIIKAPKSQVLPQGTSAGTECDQPVSLASLFTTLIDLAGLPQKQGLNEPSLLPLLQDANTEWPHTAITHLDRPNNYGISGKRFRYIHYANGDEELYDIQADPFEWQNLAGQSEYVADLQRLKASAPEEFAAFVPAKITTDLPLLDWNKTTEATLPKSNPGELTFDIFFHNTSAQPVDIFRVDADGQQFPYGTLERGWFKPYQTKANQVWVIKDKRQNELGHFVVGQESARAIIP